MKKDKMTREELDEHNARCEQFKKQVAITPGIMGDLIFVKMYDEMKIKEEDVEIIT